MSYGRLFYTFSDPRPRGGLFKGEKNGKVFDQYLAERSIEI
jgi:hypothetical protein